MGKAILMKPDGTWRVAESLRAEAGQAGIAPTTYARAMKRMGIVRTLRYRETNPESSESTKPWEAAGISRATWYRRRSRETT